MKGFGVARCRRSRAAQGHNAGLSLEPSVADDRRRGLSEPEDASDLGDVLARLGAVRDRGVESFTDAVKAVAHPVVSPHGRFEDVSQRLHFVLETLPRGRVVGDVLEVVLEDIEELADFLEINFLRVAWCGGHAGFPYAILMRIDIADSVGKHNAAREAMLLPRRRRVGVPHVSDRRTNFAIGELGHAAACGHPAVAMYRGADGVIETVAQARYPRRAIADL